MNFSYHYYIINTVSIETDIIRRFCKDLLYNKGLQRAQQIARYLYKVMFGCEIAGAADEQRVAQDATTKRKTHAVMEVLLRHTKMIRRVNYE